MRLALDCRTVTAPKTGDRTYALGLGGALPALLETGDELLYYTWEPTDLAPAAQNVRPIVLPARPRWMWTPVAFPRDLRARRADLAHVQYFVPPIAPCPVVTTIHDIAFRRHPELFPLKHRLLLNWLIPRAAHHAAHVLTGSEATRRDLLECYDLPPDHVTVTPYAADPRFRPEHPARAREAVRRRLGVPSPYILSVGVLQPRKNLPRLVRAYARIAGRVPHRLVLVGKEGWANAELRAAAAALPVDREVVFTGYVADADLPALYAGADVFAYPSLYEGFGLPPLEAMACGAPVLAGNTSSLPEVVGDAGLLVDPTSDRALVEGLERLLTDPAERDRLRAAGPQRAAEFSWERTARETLAVYHRILETAALR